MTELETQLMIALKRLCAHFEREQRQHAEERQRHAEEVEVLRQRFEQQAAENATLRQRFEQQAAENATLRRQFARLDGRMTGLAQDYETLAATLREFLS